MSAPQTADTGTSRPDSSNLSLKQVLGEELVQVRQFMALLESENEILLNLESTQTLARNTEEKHLAIDALARLQVLRNQLLTQAGYSQDRQGLHALADHEPELAAQAYGLLQLAATVRDLSDRNATIIDAYMAHHQQALVQLRQMLGAGSLYDAQGRKQDPTVANSTRRFKPA